MPNSTPPKNDEWTIIKLLEWTTAYFTSNKIDSPRSAAEILLAHVLNIQRIDLYLRYDQPLNTDELAHFKELIRRRVNREPVAYILGRREFWSMDLLVSRDVLIPRPETECLVEQALAVLTAPDAANCPIILELGTGSGAIILALLRQIAPCHGIASDISFRALRVARSNAYRHGLEGKVQFVCADWTQPFKCHFKLFDLIISNPPYIQTGQIRSLQPEIHGYEPVRALDGGDDGLRCLQNILAQAHRLLSPGGTLMMEIGHDQRNALKRVIQTYPPYEAPVFYRDYSGFDRVVSVRKRNGPGR
jgi:release factor glutamine methyltransferase